MKKIISALLIILCLASCAFAFSKKGVIPQGDPIAYKGLKITDEGVSLVLVNRSDKAVTINAALTFLDARRREQGDIYIEKTTIAPEGEAVFRDLFLKGDAKACRKAESLRWTIYLLETDK